MFGSLKSNLKTRLKGVVQDIKGRRVDAADPDVAPDLTPNVAPFEEPPVEVSAPPAVTAPAGAAASLSSLAAAAAAGKGTTGKGTSRVLHADMGSTDVASYLARAKANGRSVDSVTGGEGINTALDGEAYWGPVDNESSRAKAVGKVLTIDQFECISCGTCVEQTDKVYYLPDDGKATPIAQDGPMDLIQDAIDACPVTCIAWTPPSDAEERGLATGIIPTTT